MSTTHKTTLFVESQQEVKKFTLRSFMKAGWLQSVKDELKKVSWTSKDELKKSTKVVIGSTLFIGFGIYCVDLVIRHTLDGFHVLARLIFGA